MADRIFINKDSSQYSERELNRIDWSQVRNGMLEARKAANAGKTLNPFGMVTGLLDTKLAQFAPEEFPGDEMALGQGNDERIQMIANALTSGEDLETEDAQFGLDNAEAVAAQAGMTSEDVANALHDFVDLNNTREESDLWAESEADAGASGDEFGLGDSGLGMELSASRTAKRKLPAALANFKFKKKDGDNPEKHESKDKEDKKDKDEKDEDGEASAMLRKGDERKAARKFVFTNSSQLSASALAAAREAGDEDLVRATLAARAERRVAVGQMAAEETLEQLTREAKTKRRQAAKADKPKEVQANVKTEKIAAKEDFVKPTELAPSQKSAFASKARELGFPEPYIQHMIGTRVANVTEDDVRTVAEGAGSYKEKAERVASMIREAKLDDANRSRIMKFWVEELGYPADYIAKMVEDYKG